LTDHNHTRSPGASPDSRDGEKVNESLEVIGSSSGFEFLNIKDMGVVEVSSSDNRMGSKLEEALECLGVSVLLHKPSG
jgi:hypothetical protein